MKLKKKIELGWTTINFANIYFIVDLSVWIYCSNKKLISKTDK